jgi:hypothetical protein
MKEDYIKFYKAPDRFMLKKKLTNVQEKDGQDERLTFNLEHIADLLHYLLRIEDWEIDLKTEFNNIWNLDLDLANNLKNFTPISIPENKDLPEDNITPNNYNSCWIILNRLIKDFIQVRNEIAQTRHYNPRENNSIAELSYDYLQQCCDAVSFIFNGLITVLDSLITKIIIELKDIESN